MGRRQYLCAHSLNYPAGRVPERGVMLSPSTTPLALVLPNGVACEAGNVICFKQTNEFRFAASIATLAGEIPRTQSPGPIQGAFGNVLSTSNTCLESP